MRMKISLILVFLLLVLVHVPIRAEKINSISDNSYETEELQIILSPEQLAGTNEFVFRSSPALRGRLEVISGTSPNFEVYYHKILYAASRAQADSFAALISLDHLITGTSLILQAEAPRDAPWRRTANLSGQVECEIYLPSQYSLSLDLVGYNIVVKGPFPEADLRGNYCDEVRVSRIELGLRMDMKNSTIILRDIRGPARIISEGGNITARDIDVVIGIATFDNKRGAVQIIGFAGDELRCEVTEGKINLERIVLQNGARAYITNSGSNSDIYMDIEFLSNSRIEIFNRTADIQLLLPQEITAEFALTADPYEGKIEIDGIPLITDEVTWGKLSAHTAAYDSRIIADTRGAGRISIRRKDF